MPDDRGRRREDQCERRQQPYEPAGQPLALVGILQYVAPSLQLLIGLFAFGEVLSGPKLLGFTLIWLGVLLYSMEAVIRQT